MRNNGLGGTPKAASVPRLPGFRDRVSGRTLEPETPPRVMFGKHFGASWADVPEDYLAWILRQTDFDEGASWAASQELARREATTRAA